MFNRWKGERLIDRAHDLWNDSGQFAHTGASQANSFIHRKPLAATLLSLGAGLCFGVFYGSLRRPAPIDEPTRTRGSGRSTRSRRRRYTQAALAPMAISIRAPTAEGVGRTSNFPLRALVRADRSPSLSLLWF